MLIIGGAGFLLLWPRFFILATYLMMLGLYYMLARHEEEIISKRYGSVTDEYLARVPMFNPFRGAREDGTAKPVSRSGALAIWLAVVAVSMLTAFGLRAVAVAQLYAVQWRSPSPHVTALAFRMMSDDAINELTDTILAMPRLQTLLNQDKDIALFMQINDGRSQLKHLLIDLGMTSGALDTLDVPQDGYFVVVSRVVPRDPNTRAPPDVFSLGARIEPLILVGPSQSEDRLVARELTADQFYQGFARILF